MKYTFHKHTYLLLLLSVEVVLVAGLFSSCCHVLLVLLKDLGAELDSWAEPDVGVTVEDLKDQGLSATAEVLYP